MNKLAVALASLLLLSSAALACPDMGGEKDNTPKVVEKDKDKDKDKPADKDKARTAEKDRKKDTKDGKKDEKKPDKVSLK